MYAPSVSINYYKNTRAKYDFYERTQFIHFIEIYLTNNNILKTLTQSLIFV